MRTSWFMWPRILKSDAIIKSGCKNLWILICINNVKRHFWAVVCPDRHTKCPYFLSEHLLPKNVCSRHFFWRSQRHDQGLTLLQQQLLAAAEKTGQFGIAIQRKPAMLPNAHDSAKHSAAWHHRKSWRATKEVNCGVSKWGLGLNEWACFLCRRSLLSAATQRSTVVMLL